MKQRNFLEDSFVDNCENKTNIQELRNEIETKALTYCSILGVNDYYLDVDEFMLKVQHEQLYSNKMLLDHIKSDPIFKYLFLCQWSDDYMCSESLYKEFLDKSFYNMSKVSTVCEPPTSNIFLLLKKRLEERENKIQVKPTNTNDKDVIVKYYKDNKGRDPTKKELSDLEGFLQDKNRLIGMIIEHGLWKLE